MIRYKISPRGLIVMAPKWREKKQMADLAYSRISTAHETSTIVLIKSHWVGETGTSVPSSPFSIVHSVFSHTGRIRGQNRERTYDREKKLGVSVQNLLQGINSLVRSDSQSSSCILVFPR